MIKALQELLGRDYSALRSAIDTSTTSHKGERDSDLVIKALGMLLFTLFSLIRGIGPTLGLDAAQLPGLDIIAITLSLSTGASGLYLFRRSKDLRRGDAVPAQARLHPQFHVDPPSAPTMAKAPPIHPEPETVEPEPDPVDVPSPEPDEPAPLEVTLAMLDAAADDIEAGEDKPQSALSRIRERFSRPMPVVIPRPAKPAQEAPRRQLHDGAQASEEEQGATPSGAALPSPAPLGEPKPLPKPVVFPEDIEAEGLGDLPDDPEQQLDGDEYDPAPGGLALDFDFDEPDFDNDLEILPEDEIEPVGSAPLGAAPAEGVSDAEPKLGPRGRVDGPRGRPPALPPKRRR